MKRSATILFAFLFSFLLPVSSQQVRFLRYGVKEGLSNETINCLFKDSRGFLWAGTDFGLNRFDGVRFENWFHIPGDSNSLLHNKVNSVAEDKQQRLWIGTEKGVSVYNTRTGKFSSYPVIYAQGKKINSLIQVKTFCDNDGDVWIGSSSGDIILFRQQTKQFYDIPVQLRPESRLQNQFVSGFLHDSKNRLWAGTSYGIYLLNKDHLTATPIRFAPDHRYEGTLNACTRLFETNNGKILCGTWNSGFIVYNEQTKKFEAPNALTGTFLPNPVVSDFAQQGPVIYFATLNGLFIGIHQDLTNPINAKYTAYQFDAADNYSIGSGGISSVLTDSLGNVWIGGDKGISLLNAESRYYQSYSFGPLVKDPAWMPMSVTQNQNELYLTVGDELIGFDLRQKKFVHASLDITGKKRHRFFKTGNGYILTSQTGLYLYDDKFKLKQSISERLPDGSPLNMLRALKDSDGNTWIGTTRYGLRKYDAANHTLTKYLHDTLDKVNNVGHYTAALFESGNKTLFAGGRYLFVFDKQNNHFSILSNDGITPQDVEVINQNGTTIWIGTKEGLFDYNETTRKITAHPLPANINQVIDDIETDNSGNLWLVTLSGLVKYSPGDKSSLVFNKQNGWPGNYSFIKKLDDGSMVAGSDGRIILFDPADIKKETYSPSPQMTQLTINEKDAQFMPGNDTMFIISHNQSIRFNFVSLTYNNGGATQYTWKLEGQDNEWHPIANQTTQAFSSLSPGSYTFLVKSSNASGIESNGMATIRFKVLPPFYRTWWFITAIILSMAVVAYLFYRYNLRQALAVERLRTRISTDLHDDIGATLSSISFYSEAVRQKVKEKLPETEPILEKMGETSRSMVSNMSDIVWAINPKNDAAESLFKRMESYAAELCQLKNTEMQFAYENSIDKRSLDIETRKNIYLIFKEAVNNALKYSGSSILKIQLQVKEHNLIMNITDNGKGFDPAKKETGNGLNNMKNRAEELKGTLTVNSAGNKGTTIELFCPLP